MRSSARPAGGLGWCRCAVGGRDERRLKDCGGHRDGGGVFRFTGGTDAQPRWFLPRRNRRPGQRGANSSGWSVVCIFVLQRRRAGAETVQ